MNLPLSGLMAAAIDAIVILKAIGSSRGIIREKKPSIALSSESYFLKVYIGTSDDAVKKFKKSLSGFLF